MCFLYCPQANSRIATPSSSVAIDPEAGRVIGSVVVTGPALGLAINPMGSRVFVARLDRILTCTTTPLLNSWYYRSPGVNGTLRFPPGSDVLFAIRDHAIAQFDPQAIAARPESERHARSDDATAVIPLPAAASDLRFSEDGGLAATIGTGSLAFVDLAGRTAFAVTDLPEPVRKARHIDLLRFPTPPGDLLLATFPSLTVAAIPCPVVERPAPVVPAPVIPAPQPSDWRFSTTFPC